ncbi:hypothetical protein GGQ88_001415 [Novosphingobium hassiacum]|uniref:Uncharacterized protein n=1 Tax=Novosphingobium hassiacum TaxID=173676 RepID=A0A7W5ZVS7_9SPHN|nr:hypothetical protein [Novosphingobium hassiacum]MBB3860154.1 hypothetical protein [Novosphingobium hassiacum]
MTAKSSAPVTGRDEFEREFMATLIEDAARALHRFASVGSVEIAAKDLQAARRDLVRNLHAAIEGAVWAFREHVRSTAKSLDVLSRHEEIALSEESIQVSERGTVSAQRRNLTLVSTIRLTTKIAVRLNPTLTPSFDTTDWANFRSSVATRNRVTHPKAMDDLVVSADDASSSIAAFYWLIELVVTGMETTNAAMRGYVRGLAEAIEGLRAGDPTIVAAYRELLHASWD